MLINWKFLSLFSYFVSQSSSVSSFLADFFDFFGDSSAVGLVSFREEFRYFWRNSYCRFFVSTFLDIFTLWTEKTLVGGIMSVWPGSHGFECVSTFLQLWILYFRMCSNVLRMFECVSHALQVYFSFIAKILSNFSRVSQVKVKPGVISRRLEHCSKSPPFQPPHRPPSPTWRSTRANFYLPAQNSFSSGKKFKKLRKSSKNALK